MSNTDLYMSHYNRNNSTLLLYPISGTFVNLNSYLISFNEIKDTDKLHTILEYYAYQQIQAFKIKDTLLFERVKHQIDILIDRDWKKSNKHKELLTKDLIWSTDEYIKQLRINKNIAPSIKNQEVNIFNSTLNASNTIISNSVLYDRQYWVDRIYPVSITKFDFNFLDKYQELFKFNLQQYNKIKTLELNNSMFFGFHNTQLPSILFNLINSYTRNYPNDINILQSFKYDKQKIAIISDMLSLYRYDSKLSFNINNIINLNRFFKDYISLNRFVISSIDNKQIINNTSLLLLELNKLSNESVLSTLYTLSYPIRELLVSTYLNSSKYKETYKSSQVIGYDFSNNELTNIVNLYTGMKSNYNVDLNTRLQFISKSYNRLLDNTFSNILWSNSYNRPSFLSSYKYWTDHVIQNSSTIIKIRNIDKLYKPQYFHEIKSIDKLKYGAIPITIWYDHSISKELLIVKNLCGDIKHKEFVILDTLIDLTYGMIEAIITKSLSGFEDSHSTDIHIHNKSIRLNGTHQSIIKLTSYLLTDSSLIQIANNVKMKWNGIIAKDSILNNTIQSIDRVNQHDSIINDKHILTTKDKLQAYKQKHTQVITENPNERKIKVDINEPNGEKIDCSITVNDDHTLTTKQLRELYLKEKNNWTEKSNKTIIVEEKNNWTEKSNKTIIVEEKNNWTEKLEHNVTIDNNNILTDKREKDVLVIDNITNLTKLDSIIKVDSISYWVEKQPTNISTGRLYILLENTQKQIYIDTKDNIPMDLAYKTISQFNSLIAFTKEANKVQLSDVTITDKKEKNINGLLSNEILADKTEKSVFGLLSNTENFEKIENNVILSSRDAQLLLDKDPKKIIIVGKPTLADIDKRWYFIPNDGPYDPIILPLDYPYAEHPINGVVTTNHDKLPYPFTAKDVRSLTYEHPIPNGSDMATVEIKVSIYIMANVIDFCYYLLDAYKDLYSRYTPSQALKHFVNLIFNWLDGQIPDVAYRLPEFYEVNYEVIKLYESYREDYWRLYRWIRWYAESLIQNTPDSDLNTLQGIQYVNKLLSLLVKYFNDHHGIYSRLPGKKTIDKVKGARHVWLSRYKNKL